MRVIAGEHRGRRLLAPPGRSTRPTSDRVREAMFSMLESLGALQGATVWDLFAGSGAMGIEALSRGAERATFVDQARTAVTATRANLGALGYGPPRAVVVCAEAVAWAVAAVTAPAPTAAPAAKAPASAATGGPDLVFADPPYAWDRWADLLGALAPARPLVMMESGTEPALPPGWDVLRRKSYGGTVVTLTRFGAGDQP